MKRAILFAEWCGKNGWKYRTYSNMWAQSIEKCISNKLLHKSTEELYLIAESEGVFKGLDAVLIECPVCKQKAGKTYSVERLPTICQKCDHIWLLA